MARRHHLGEAVDDHQVPFARRLASAGLVTLVDDVPGLVQALRGDVTATPWVGGAATPLALELRGYLEGEAGVRQDAGEDCVNAEPSGTVTSGVRRGLRWKMYSQGYSQIARIAVAVLLARALSPARLRRDRDGGGVRDAGADLLGPGLRDGPDPAPGDHGGGPLDDLLADDRGRRPADRRRLRRGAHRSRASTASPGSPTSSACSR